MIARIWKGMVPAAKADAYVDLMTSRAIPDYRAVAGNLGAWCLHRPVGNAVEVVMLTFWEDMDSIAAFAGTPVDKAKYYDFDAAYLLEAPETVDHYQMGRS